MTVPQYYQPMQTRPKRPVWPWISLLVVVVLGIVAVAVTIAVTGSSKEDAPQMLTVTGSFTLNDGVTAYASNGGDCQGARGYNDITAGAQVTVYTSSGAVAAVGELGPGRHGPSVSCEFDFSVAGVPAGEGPYQIEVSHRGKIAFTEQDAGNVSLTLGS